MKKLMFKIIFFVFALNLASGLLNHLVTTDEGNLFQSGEMYQTYDESKVNISEQFFSVNTEGISGDRVGSNDGLLNAVTLGFWSKFTRLKRAITNYLFGVTDIFENIGWIDSTIAYMLNWVLSLIYAVGIFTLFTRTRVND